MTPLPATPVPVTPPQVPPRPPLWALSWPCFDHGKYIGWATIGHQFEKGAQEQAATLPGSVIFRLPGSAELADPLTRQLTDSIAAIEGRKA